MKRQRHTNILELYAAFVTDHFLWMVMPFVSGGSLETLLKLGYSKVCIRCSACLGPHVRPRTLSIQCMLMGRPTRSYRARMQGLREVEIATIMKQVLEALAYLHGRGVLHRDIKVLLFRQLWNNK